MLLTFADDFSNAVSLDDDLVSTPESGLYWNKGVHPYLSINNLLSFLPNKNFVFAEWNELTEYNKFSDTFNKTDIVTYDSNIYLSLSNENTNNQPDTSPLFWLKTNIESLRLRSFIHDVELSMKSSLSLQRRLIESQYIEAHSSDIREILQNGTFAGWCFEPKGSDYVNIRINKICLQATTTDDINIYVVNDGNIKETIVFAGNDGKLVYQNVNINLNYKGATYIVCSSQNVMAGNEYNDHLKYDSFVAYPVIGYTGTNANDPEYSYSNVGNGFSFQLSTHTNPDDYVSTNWPDFAKLLQCQFEINAFEMFLTEPNNRVNRDTINISSINQQVVVAEIKNKENNTIASKYFSELERVKKSIDKTIDKFLQASRDDDYSFSVTEVGL